MFFLSEITIPGSKFRFRAQNSKISRLCKKKKSRRWQIRAPKKWGPAGKPLAFLISTSLPASLQCEVRNFVSSFIFGLAPFSWEYVTGGTNKITRLWEKCPLQELEWSLIETFSRSCASASFSVPIMQKDSLELDRIKLTCASRGVKVQLAW